MQRRRTVCPLLIQGDAIAAIQVHVRLVAEPVASSKPVAQMMQSTLVILAIGNDALLSDVLDTFTLGVS